MIPKTRESRYLYQQVRRDGPAGTSMATKELNKTSLCWIVHRSNLRFCNFGFEMLDSSILKFPRVTGQSVSKSSVEGD